MPVAEHLTSAYRIQPREGASRIVHGRDDGRRVWLSLDEDQEMPSLGDRIIDARGTVRQIESMNRQSAAVVRVIVGPVEAWPGSLA